MYEWRFGVECAKCWNTELVEWMVVVESESGWNTMVVECRLSVEASCRLTFSHDHSFTYTHLKMTRIW